MVMTDRSYRWLLWTLVLIGASLDQVSKYGVFKWLYNDGQGGNRLVIASAFEIVASYPPSAKTGEDPGQPPENHQALEQPKSTLALLRTWSGEKSPSVNEGALFGLGKEYKHLANGIFAAISVLAALAIIFWSTRPTTARDRALCASLGLILAGTLGNLYDRLIFNGVRDFLYFRLMDGEKIVFNWPVFNFADCCLVFGAGLLLLQAFQPQQSPEDAATATASVSSHAAHAEYAGAAQGK